MRSAQRDTRSFKIVLATVVIGTGLVSTSVASAGALGVTVTTKAAATHAAGDLDGDGKSDLVIGRLESILVTYTSAAPLGSHTQSIALPNDADIDSLAVGDFNGDGYSDVVVGDGEAEPFTIDDSDGEVLIYPGSATGLDLTPTVITGPKNRSVHFGSVLAAGRVNSDRYDDLLVGDDEEPGTTLKMLPGGPHGLAASRESTFSTVHGVTYALAIGDLNHDGHNDIAIGHPLAGKQITDDDNLPENSEGCLQILYGEKTGLPGSSQKLCGRAVGTGIGELGSSIAIGRINKGAYADLVAGAPSARGTNTHCTGKVVVIYGGKHGLSAKRRTVDGAASKGVAGHSHCAGSFGTAVSVGDVNGDKYGDLLIGAPDGDIGSSTGPGALYVVRGSKNGLATSHGQQFRGHAKSIDGFGSSVQALHPSGTRFASVAAGAPQFGASSASAHGYVEVFRGSTSGLKLQRTVRGEKLNDIGLTIAA